MYEKIFDLSFRCLICDKNLSKGFYYCNDCAIKYGMADENGKFKRPLEWEDWARDYYNWRRRERRWIKKMDKTWVVLNDETVHYMSNSVIDCDESINGDKDQTKEKLTE